MDLEYIWIKDLPSKKPTEEKTEKVEKEKMEKEENGDAKSEQSYAEGEDQQQEIPAALKPKTNLLFILNVIEVYIKKF